LDVKVGGAVHYYLQMVNQSGSVKHSGAKQAAKIIAWSIWAFCNSLHLFLDSVLFSPTEDLFRGTNIPLSMRWNERVGCHVMTDPVMRQRLPHVPDSGVELKGVVSWSTGKTL